MANPGGALRELTQEAMTSPIPEDPDEPDEADGDEAAGEVARQDSSESSNGNPSKHD